MGQSSKGPASTPCCQGNFKPDDLFAATSLAGDMERARQGDLASTLRVGFAYYTGMAGIVDIPRARSYFLVASQSSLAAAAWLGYLDAAARIKPGAAARSSASFRGLVKAAKAGDPVGMTLLGRVYERGLAGYKPRPDKAQPLYAAAAPNFALAKTRWGKLLLNAGNYAQAISLFQEAASAGETIGMISLADLYSRMKHPAKVAELKLRLRKAGEKGDSVALYLNGVQAQQGKSGFQANPQRALKLLHRSATTGQKSAQNALATAYAGGVGAAASVELAQFWARKASLPSLNKPGPPVRAGQERSATAG
jgi:TPR repeat protein